MEQTGLWDDVIVKQFMSGMTEAADIWLVLSLLALRENNPVLKLHCLSPCWEQTDKWAASSRDIYRLILEQVDSIGGLEYEN